MVTTPAASTVYWLSSRCVVATSTTSLVFGFQIVGPSSVYTRGPYTFTNYNITNDTYKFAVRPLVVIPLNECVILENGDTYDIIPRP